MLDRANNLFEIYGSLNWKKERQRRQEGLNIIEQVNNFYHSTFFPERKEILGLFINTIKNEKKKHAKKWQLEVGFYMLFLCIIDYLDTN